MVKATTSSQIHDMEIREISKSTTCTLPNVERGGAIDGD